MRTDLAGTLAELQARIKRKLLKGVSTDDIRFDLKTKRTVVLTVFNGLTQAERLTRKKANFLKRQPKEGGES